MTYNMGKYEIETQGEVTNIAFGITADYAYERYCAKKKMIADLEYECELLVNKYHSEMQMANIPYQFSENHLRDMFTSSKEFEKIRKCAREMFLEKGFSEEFLKKNKVEFVRLKFLGYNRTAIGVVLGIGDYEYTIEFPQPQNILNKEVKERLMGNVKFRVDRLHKSKKDEFIKEMESVQMPTYDWKKCFEAIEADVEKEG